MAHSSDIEKKLVVEVASALLGNVVYLPGTVANSINGHQVKIGRGWPLPTAIDTDTKANITTVSIFPVPGMTKLTTRYLYHPHIVYTYPVTVTANVVSNAITFGGSYVPHQGVGVGLYEHQGYVFRSNTATDTSNIAATFATMIPNATSNASTLNLPTDRVICNVFGDSQVNTETRRQEQVFRISVWAYSPKARDDIVNLIDSAMAKVRAFVLPDLTATDVPKYVAYRVDDVPEKAAIWVGHLDYRIEYPTVDVCVDPAALFVGGFINDPVVFGYVANGAPTPPEPPAPITTIGTYGVTSLGKSVYSPTPPSSP